MLYDKEFLRQLDSSLNKVVYAKITALTMDEYPINAIEGKVTGGNISLDGASAVRRTCSLTLVAEDVNIQDYYWGLNTKFKLEIGLQNDINTNYPSIIWFPQGIFVITSFKTGLTTNNYTISISGKDKMCLLNGEIGGSLNSSVNFGSIEEIDNNGNLKIISYPIKDIIRESVHQYGGEPFHNIVINDLDDMGLELLEYRYDTDLFLLRYENEDTYHTGTFDGTTDCYVNGNIMSLNDIPVFDSLTSGFIDTEDPTVFTFEVGGKTYCAARIQYGQTAGYRLTDLTYPGDLIANVGESLTSVLDKIKNMLGDFEYFYDLDGRFVFQRKPTYVNVLYSPLISNEDDVSYIEGLEYSSSASYTFNGNELIAGFNNTPNLTNLKNDFSVWGTRKSTTSGKELPVHMRYAIDEKPYAYTSITVSEEELVDYNTKHNVNLSPQESVRYTTEGETGYDWRELIYQMAKDYLKYNHLDDFALKIIEANKNDELYITGRTGYEQYYIDILGFWRELYDPYWNQAKEDAPSGQLTVDDLGDFYLGLEGDEEIVENPEETGGYYDDQGDDKSRYWWARDVFDAPDRLNFWFDFLDVDGILNQFSNKMIGNRPKAVSDNTVKGIYFKETPSIVFVTAEEFGKVERKTGYRYFLANNLDNMFAASSQGKSAKDKIDELLYNHAYCSESVSLTTIPIYYLEPNTRIHVFDEKTNINGDYIISKIAIQLGHDKTMSITATKAVERLL